MSEFNLYRAECLGNPKNCRYPEKITVRDAESLREACGKDYVAVAYAGGYRKEENFRKTDCLAMDCDNDHSENPREWITPEMIREMLPDVTMGIHYSRNHNREKNGKPARPRFHCFFRIDEMNDAKQYSELKKQIHQLFPFFDSRALDAARFFFGTENPEVEFQPGKISLNECLAMYYPEDPFAELPDPRIIPQGCRNSTMHRTAIRIMKRLGVTEEARAMLDRFATELEPKLAAEYAEIGDWAGKLVGNVLRIAGLLGRAEIFLTRDFLADTDEIQIDGRIMGNAIRLGKYYLSNALAAYDVLPEKPMHTQANYILDMIHKKKMKEFDRRMAMRYCKSFKTVDEIQPVLDFLEDYGYIFEIPMPMKPLTGRPPLPRYTVNPKVAG